jgi:hypothetical protein
MHKIILFLTSSSAPALTTYNWIGAATGTWNTPGNWSPAVVPNSTTAVATIDNNPGGSPVLNCNANVTINRLNLTSAATNWAMTANGGSISFGGVSPQLNATRSSVFSCPVTLLSDLSLNMNSNQQLNFTGVWTNGSKNITLTSTSGGLILLNAANTGTGTYFYIGNGLNLFNNSGFGTMTVNWTNGGSVTSSIVKQSPATGLSNNVVFNDTGTQNYFLNGNTSMTVTGTWSGDVKHDLILSGVNFTGANLSGLTFSGAGRIVFSGTSTLTTANALNNAVTISLGDATNAGATLTYSSTSISNPIIIRPITTGATYNLTPSANATISSNIIMNQNAVVAGTHFFQLSSSGTSTYSGVMSNGASGASTITFNYNTAGSLTMSNTNTYTSPTIVNGAGRLNVTGSIGSSSLTTISNGTLQGNGTVGPVTISTINGKIEARELASPSTSDVLTINGALTENASTAHTFQIGASNASSKLQVNGNITCNGTVAVNASTLGTFVICTYTGTRSGTWTTAISGGSITNDDANKRILLTIV